MELKVEKGLMLTSLAPNSNISKYKKVLNGQQGFSIIEILVAIVLLVVVFTMLPQTMTQSERDKIQSSITKIDRAISFATSEAILRNSIIRIKLNLDKDPIEYSIEYGQGSDIVLPQTKDLSKLSIRDREVELKKLKKLDGQFAKVDEFVDSDETLPEGIYIYALGTTYTPDLVKDGNAFIYFYPTGEKDNAIIIFNSSQEIATLKISPFEEKTFDDYFVFSESDLANLDYTLENKAKDIFEKWLKE